MSIYNWWMAGGKHVILQRIKIKWKKTWEHKEEKKEKRLESFKTSFLAFPFSVCLFYLWSP